MYVCVGVCMYVCMYVGYYTVLLLIYKIYIQPWPDPPCVGPPGPRGPPGSRGIDGYSGLPVRIDPLSVNGNILWNLLGPHWLFWRERAAGNASK